MKKLNKKGFTLIELMAVVIVLIIIIFIALNKINDSSQRTRNNALIANAGSYVKAVNSFLAEQSVNNDDFEAGIFSVLDIENFGVNISGTKPTAGAVSVIDSEIDVACLIIDGYKLEYKNGEVLEPKTGDCSLVIPVEEYDYTGSYQTFTAPINGYYRIELWGAQGGSYGDRSGGKGGYTSGEIYLNEGTTLYIYVGGFGPANQSVTNVGGWNGGGYSGNNGGSYSYGGGGATDVRLVAATWSDATSLRSRIMVAGGGGGAFSTTSYTSVPGVGGNLIGGDGGGNYNCTTAGGGKQTTYGSAQDSAGRGSFGYAYQGYVNSWGGGGGGGYWGGSLGCGRAGGGGSSFISGHKGAVAVISSESNSPRLDSNNTICTEGTTDIVCSYHYSGKIFKNTSMKSGKERMPSYDGETKKVGNAGDGHAKISRVYTSQLENESFSYEYAYTGAKQTFVTPKTGTYKVELWGASGIPNSTLKSSITTGGSYTSGEIFLEKGTTLYVFVGQEGYSKDGASDVSFDNTQLSFNGGGKGSRQCGDGSQYGGITVAGGATDIRVVDGNWNDEASLRSRIMVAGASGGTTYNSDGSDSIGGPGGGITGYDGTKSSYGTGATQISGGSNGGSFGIGGNASWTTNACSTDEASGGGGGWYGGGGATATGSGTYSSGGSGSSYISGHKGCVAVQSKESSLPKSGCESGSTDINCSKSPYNYIFSNTLMIDGSGYEWTNIKQDVKAMPKPTGGYYDSGKGHIGNGYAKIYFVK